MARRDELADARCPISPEGIATPTSIRQPSWLNSVTSVGNSTRVRRDQDGAARPRRNDSKQKALQRKARTRGYSSRVQFRPPRDGAYCCRGRCRTYVHQLCTPDFTSPVGCVKWRCCPIFDHGSIGIGFMVRRYVERRCRLRRRVSSTQATPSITLNSNRTVSRGRLRVVCVLTHEDGVSAAIDHPLAICVTFPATQITDSQR